MPTSYSYVVKRDKGIAPNICGGILTDALCGQGIRRGAQVGDWVVGLWPAPNNTRVTYVMRVGRKLPFEEYWNAPEFEVKKPGHCETPDNIYKPDGRGGFKKVPGTDKIAGPGDIKNHVYDGRFVLVADRFWYFGGTPCELPQRFRSLDRPQARIGCWKRDWSDAQLEDFVKWLDSHGAGVLGSPRDPI